MPKDPRHGRDLPAGVRLRSILRRFFARLRHLPPGADYTAFAPALASAIEPDLAILWRRGQRDHRRHRRQSANKAIQLGDDEPRRLIASLVREPLTGDVLVAVRHAAMEFAVSTLATLRMDRIDAEVTHQERTREAVETGLQSGRGLIESSAEVLEVFESPHRAARIAATESSRAVHAGQLAEARASGVIAAKRWLASSDACELCEALNNVEVPLDEPFYVDPRGGPYAVVMHPPRHPWCMCTFVEVLE